MRSARQAGDTWAVTLAKLCATTKNIHILEWIDNAQYHHEAESSAARKQAAERENGIRHWNVDDSDIDSEDDDNRDDSQVATINQQGENEDYTNLVPFMPNLRTRLFAEEGMLTAENMGVFPNKLVDYWTTNQSSLHRFVVDDENALQDWKQAMDQDIILQRELGVDNEFDVGDVVGDVGATTENNPSIVHLDMMHVDDVDDTVLLPDQQRAFDIIRDQIELQKRCPSAPPLHLLVLGEGGTGKSEVVKKATKLLQTSKHDSTALSISAFMGIAASKVGGSTTHREWEIRVQRSRAVQNWDNSKNIGAEAKRRLVDKFKARNWAFCDEVSMISAKFFYTIAQHADIAKAGTYDPQQGTSFGNMNVVLFSDFYQFPPVTGRALYNTSGNMNEDEQAGCAIFEQFNRVVILRDQV